jgi:hypothetical protein
MGRGAGDTSKNEPGNIDILLIEESQSHVFVANRMNGAIPGSWLVAK